LIGRGHGTRRNSVLRTALRVSKKSLLRRVGSLSALRIAFVAARPRKTHRGAGQPRSPFHQLPIPMQISRDKCEYPSSAAPSRLILRISSHHRLMSTLESITEAMLRLLRHMHVRLEWICAMAMSCIRLCIQRWETPMTLRLAFQLRLTAGKQKSACLTPHAIKAYLPRRTRNEAFHILIISNLGAF
jgi:hypothetical protein